MWLVATVPDSADPITAVLLTVFSPICLSHSWCLVNLVLAGYINERGSQLTSEKAEMRLDFISEMRRHQFQSISDLSLEVTERFITSQHSLFSPSWLIYLVGSSNGLCFSETFFKL